MNESAVPLFTNVADVAPDALLKTLLQVSLTGVILFRPVYSPEGLITDLAYVHLNPAAQRMLRLPERPAETFLTPYPHTLEMGIFAFYRDTYLSGAAGRYDVNYSHDGLDNYFHLAAQPSGSLLVVSFSDTAEQDRTPVELALRESQARERQARRETEAERQRLHQVLMRMPATIALLRGPEHVYELVNPEYERLFPARTTLGRPIREVIPEIAGQGFFELFDCVYQTGEPYYAPETEAWADFSGTGQLERRYYRTCFEPIRNAQGEVEEVLNFAVDVTFQVEARQQVETLNAQLMAARAEAETQRERLYNLFMQAPALICLFEGPEHVFQFVNPPYQQLVGERPLLGKPIREAMPELKGQPIFGLLDAVYRTGEPFYAYEQLVQLDHHNSGELGRNYYNFTYQATRNPAGDIEGILVFAYQVTPLIEARQRVEQLNGELAASNEELSASNEELRASTEELQAANEELLCTQRQLEALNAELEMRVSSRTQQLEATLQLSQQQGAQLLQHQGLLERILGQVPASIATFSGPEHQCSFFNTPYQTLSGKRTQLGLSVAQVFPEVVAQGFIQLLDEVYATGKPFIGTEIPAHLYDLATGQPQQRYLDFIYQPLVDEQNRTTGILAFVLDVTEKVRTRQQAKESERSLELAVEIGELGVFTVELVKNRATYSPRVMEWFGFQNQRLPMDKIFSLIHPQDQSYVVETVKRSLMQEADGRHDLTYRLVHPETGKLQYFRSIGQVLWENGQPVTLSGIIQEVTHQEEAKQRLQASEQQAQRLAEELAAANKELQAANEEIQSTNEELGIANVSLIRTNRDLNQANSDLNRTNIDLDNFIYIASHDLKAPISNIEGLLANLVRSLPAEVLASERVGRITSLMGESVERFKRTIANLTEVVKLQKENSGEAVLVNLSEVVQEVVLDLESLITSSGAELTVDVIDCPTIRFSEKNLRSVVYNLISNALKYRSPERVPHVQIACERTSDYHILRVSDNGLGMEPGRLGQLFTMFKRFHTHVEGSGIGLYIIKRMVENAGGKIEVESQVGAGSTFRVYFTR